MKLRFEFSVEEVAVLDAALFCYQKDLDKVFDYDDPQSCFFRHLLAAERLSHVLLNDGEVVSDGKQ